MLDYETMKFIWWVLLGVVLIGYAVMDGFDLGVASLLPFIAKNDVEKRMMINSIGPFWEGNQIWLITAGGVIFAAWPYVYATSFSGFYFAMLLILLALILRPVAFKFRSKYNSFGWRNTWDWIHFASGFLPALLAGVAVGNVILGVPFYFDHESLQVYYTGSFFGLLRPFALLTGLISVAMLVRHGAIYVALKVDEPVAGRAIVVASWASKVMIFLVVVACVWAFKLNGYVITNNIDHNAPANPIYKTVAVQSGAYVADKWKIVVPLLGIVFSSLSVLLVRKRKELCAFISSALSLFFIISTAGVGMFPFIIPSSSNPNDSLTVWDSSSSLLTLKLMLLITCTVLPIVLGYTVYVYVKLRGKIMASMFSPDNKDNEHAY